MRVTWWRLQMETFSALLAMCAGNSPVPVNSQHKGQWRGALMSSLIRALHKRLSKQSWGWWFETQSLPLWRHCNVRHCGVKAIWPGLHYRRFIHTPTHFYFKESPSGSRSPSIHPSEHWSNRYNLWRVLCFPLKIQTLFNDNIIIFSNCPGMLYFIILNKTQTDERPNNKSTNNKILIEHNIYEDKYPTSWYS